MRKVERGEAAAYADKMRERLNEEMLRCGLTYKDLAFLSGLGESSVWRVLNGGRRGNFETVYAMAAALNIDFDPVPASPNHDISDFLAGNMRKDSDL